MIGRVFGAFSPSYFALQNLSRQLLGLLASLQPSAIECAGYWSKGRPEFRFAGLKGQRQILLWKAAASGARTHGPFEVFHGCQHECGSDAAWAVGPDGTGFAGLVQVAGPDPDVHGLLGAQAHRA